MDVKCLAQGKSSKCMDLSAAHLSPLKNILILTFPFKGPLGWPEVHQEGVCGTRVTIVGGDIRLPEVRLTLQESWLL